MIDRYHNYGDEDSVLRDPVGRWVLYEDHQKIVDDAVKQLDNLSAEVYRLKKNLAGALNIAATAFARE